MCEGSEMNLPDIRAAATQLNAELGNVSVNFDKSRNLIIQAAENKVKYLVLPEFFTSSMAINDCINRVARQNRELKVIQRVQELSVKYSMIISGSLLNIIGEDIYNSMFLAYPNGRLDIHNKDLPTQFENAYYTRGDNHYHFQRIGLVMCWEMLRTRTIREIIDQVDLVLAASCWWDLPLNSTKDKLREFNHRLNRNTPRNFARLLGVPVVHSSHVGSITGKRNLTSDEIVERKLIGTTQIIDHTGKVISQIDDQNDDAILIADIELKRKVPPPINQDRFWLVDLPEEYLAAWEKENRIGEKLYKKHTNSMLGRS